MQKPSSQCFGNWVERSGFETCQGQCVVFLVKTFYSKCLSAPRGINGYRQILGVKGLKVFDHDHFSRVSACSGAERFFI